MSKFKTKLAKFFLDQAKKLDDTVVKDEFVLPQQPITFINYDKYHVDKIHAQYAVTDIQRDAYDRMKGYENFIQERIPELISKGIADEIMKVHKDEIQETRLASMEGTLYELDVYVCKPIRKESL